MLASALHIYLLPWAQGNLQRVLRMICRNGLLLPLSSSLALIIQKASCLLELHSFDLGQILWVSPPAP